MENSRLKSDFGCIVCKCGLWNLVNQSKAYWKVWHPVCFLSKATLKSLTPCLLLWWRKYCQALLDMLIRTGILTNVGEDVMAPSSLLRAPRGPCHEILGWRCDNQKKLSMPCWAWQPLLFRCFVLKCWMYPQDLDLDSRLCVPQIVPLPQY